MIAEGALANVTTLQNMNLKDHVFKALISNTSALSLWASLTQDVLEDNSSNQVLTFLVYKFSSMRSDIYIKKINNKKKIDDSRKASQAKQKKKAAKPSSGLRESLK